MKTIRVSEEVYDEIYRRGKMKDTPDSVLRRVLDIPDDSGEGGRRSKGTGHSKKRLSTKFADGQFIVEFADGISNQWTLPDREDKKGIRRVRDEALDFAKKNGASYGQLEAVTKALREEGYYITK
jgi:hypothetical protein